MVVLDDLLTRAKSFCRFPRDDDTLQEVHKVNYKLLSVTGWLALVGVTGYHFYTLPRPLAVEEAKVDVNSFIGPALHGRLPTIIEPKFVKETTPVVVPHHKKKIVAHSAKHRKHKAGAHHKHHPKHHHHGGHHHHHGGHSHHGGHTGGHHHHTPPPHPLC
jgi:ABC-type Zn2+ transport system substrate-binding protein/surface adhesin